MSVGSVAQTYTLTLPDKAAAQRAADRLAERGHRLVAVRIVDHFTFDPSSWWYGKAPMRPEHAGWWDVFSVVQDPPLPENAQERAERLETKAVAAIARDLGGFASERPGGGLTETILRSFSRVGLVHELDAQHADEVRRTLVGAATGPSAEPPPAAPLPHTRIAMAERRCSPRRRSPAGSRRAMICCRPAPSTAPTLTR